MAQINIHNYEAYLLDFSEGNLPAELQVELEVFLMNHPELAVDFNELANLSLTADHIAFNHKDALKKTDSDLVSEPEFIAYVEGQLNNEDARKLERSCELNKSLSSELELYKQTILKADKTIVFPDKALLKRQGKVVWFNFTLTQYAAAAALLLIAGLFALWFNSTLDEKAMMALKVKAEKHNATPLSVNPTEINNQDLSNPIAQTTKKKTTNIITTKKELQQPQPQLANNNNPELTSDTSSNEVYPVIPEKTANSANTTLLADNSVNTTTKSSTVVEVITENDDEGTEQVSQKKKGFWAMAGRTLKTLNSAGVKSVNGKEEDKSNNTSYALTLGGINITHKSGKL